AFIPPILALVGLGAATKSAQFPFHFWLPNAMEAPTPVSAYLHSSTMVKAGVYLVMRLNPAFQDIPAWGWMLAGLGATTMILGAVLACRETYFKKVLAYSTVSSLGIMVLFTAIGGEYGAKAAVGYLLAHALFKACLFLTAGTVTHETGRKDIESLGGLRRTMPLTAAFGLIGALSMAGFPPLFGFVGKELLLKSSVHPTEASVLHDQAALVTTLVMIAAILTVMVSVLVGWRPFFAKQADPDEPVKGHEPGVRMLAGPAILALLTIVVPLAPALMAKPLIGAGIVSLTGAEAESVKVGFLDMLAKIELPFYLSIGALVAGTALYLARGFWRPALTATLRAFNPIGAPAIYDHSFNASAWFARFQVRQLQSGHLRRYITIIILVTVGLVVGALARSGQGIPTDISSFNVGVLDLVLLTLMVAGAVACTRYRSRLSTVAALGVVGYAVAVTFVVLGVPDIAMTQFSIETLTVIIFVLVVYHLPRFNVYSGAPRRVFDAIIALAFGAVMTSLVLVAQTNAVTGIPRISDQLGDWAYTEAFGRNVVNVILVDFRGIDTMVEIFVLGIAAVGVYTLLKLRADRPEDDKPRLTETEATT
ncbi:MAG: hydrogen gas-evolving membrane-bound hydrogenase subunit E, partial [Planctomycetota bacterium]